MDEILNFGEFWEEKGIRKHKQHIIRLTKEISAQFQRAYRFLHAAYDIASDSEAIYKACTDAGAINCFLQDIVHTLFCDERSARKEGNNRRLFLSAVTPAGLVHYLDDSMVGLTAYGIRVPHGFSADKILQKIQQEACIRGYDTESFYCGFNPNKLEHVIIPAKKCAFVTLNDYHVPHTEYTQWLNMTGFLNKTYLDEKEGDLSSNHELFDQLLQRAVSMLKKAKTMHDELETYYVPYIDFGRVNECLKLTLERILSAG